MSILGWVVLYFVVALPVAIFVGTVMKRMGEDYPEVPDERK